MGTLRGLRATILYIGLGAHVCSRLSDDLACLPTSHPGGGRRVGAAVVLVLTLVLYY